VSAGGGIECPQEISQGEKVRLSPLESYGITSLKAIYDISDSPPLRNSRKSVLFQG